MKASLRPTRETAMEFVKKTAEGEKDSPLSQ